MADKPVERNLEYLDELFEKRIIIIDKEFTEETCAEWIGKLILLDLQGAKTKKPIIILINSYGGDLHGALGLMRIIKNSVCPVYTVCIGIAQSSGSIILSAGKKRYSVPNASIMIHCHRISYNSEYNHFEIMNESEGSKKSFKQLEDYYVEVTGQTHPKIKKLLEKNSYLTAEEALSVGLIDEIGWDIHNWVTNK